MRGIAGFLKPYPLTEGDQARLTNMVGLLTHRGPDKSDCWTELWQESRSATADFQSSTFRRPGINQWSHPRVGTSLYIVYTGEIYNYREFRHELEEIGAAPMWCGHSDTEVLLAVIEQSEVVRALERLNGMLPLRLGTVRSKALRSHATGWEKSVFIMVSVREASSCSARNSRHWLPIRHFSEKSIVTL